MCGLCGELNLVGNSVDLLDIERMAGTITHRGPDDLGTYCNGIIGLAHRRLSIIDLSSKAKQPMWSNNSNLCIVYNGEVYNYKEIKQDLLAKGYHFSSNSDTEVVVNAIECWGIDRALSRFIGMFAFAIWDRRNRVLILCRDRAGIKPLYYYLTSERFVFGSELKALMAHSKFAKYLNSTAIGQYFITGCSLGSNTVFRNTSKLAPGHFLKIDSTGSWKLHKYWSLDTIKRGAFQGTFKDATDQLEELLESAFAYRLVSDVPIGLFLSGGIDSSLLSAILKKRLDVDVLNITIGFGEKKYDESPKARKVAAQLGVNHIVHYVSAKEAQDTLLKFCDIYDEPFADTSGIPTYILARVAREHVKVALSADGGDEQFCGYDTYGSYLRSYKFLNKFPWLLRNIVSKILENVIPYRRLISWELRRRNEPLYNSEFIGKYEKMLRLLRILTEQDVIRLMNETAWYTDTINHLLPVGKDQLFKDTVLSPSHLASYDCGLLDAMMRTDFSLFLQDDILVKVDRASMFASLEVRDPFLDHRITEFAYSLPTSYLFTQWQHKIILKAILRKWITEDIISSPKRGFVIPLDYWLRGAWKPIVLEYLSKSRVRSVGFLDEKHVEKEVYAFYKYDGSRTERIWRLLNFQMWAEKWYCNY